MEIVSLKEFPEDIGFFNITGLEQTIKNGDNWSFMESSRPNHALLYISAGEAHITTEDGITQIWPCGNLIYLPRGSRYSIFFFNSTGTSMNIHVNFLMRRYSGREVAFADRIICLTENTPPKIVASLTAIYEQSLNSKNSAFSIGSAFYGFLNQLKNHLALTDFALETNRTVFPAICYLDSHISDNVPIPDLAKMCMLSETVFRKKFHLQTGMSPSQYKLYSKIEKAKMFIRSSDEYSIEEIADRLGFFDSSHFYKTFLSITGMTPKQYQMQTTD